jgi:(S)-3,5-dihydroxyphenylglycine transaminase
MNRTENLLTLDDFAARAQQCLDPDIWDFVAGGAGAERTLRANRDAFDRVRLSPRVLTGGASVGTAVEIVGRTWAAPVGVAPMAHHTLVHTDGEVATVQGAGAVGLPTIVSTFAGRTFEAIASDATAPLWLQVYAFKDRSVTRRLIERAEQAGFEALVLTVDVPFMGRRLRDLRNEFRLPAGVKPANLAGIDVSSPQAHTRAVLDPYLDWSIVDWLRSVSRLPVILKGILAAGDAQRSVDAGVDGIVVSNHGGRQLDGVASALDVLPEIAEVVAGRCLVLADGGISRGTDILACLASGADAVLVGRPVLYGLAVAGRDGVAEVLRTLVDELTDAMALAGVDSLAEVAPDLLVGTSSWVRPAVTRPQAVDGTVLHKDDLHASLSDPVLDSMTFLNEITARYPEAISFAPGRPYEDLFDVEEVLAHVRRYLHYLAEQGASEEQIRGALCQYGPTAGLIRDIVAMSLREDEHIVVDSESIVVTVGAQEAMLLILRALFSSPRDVLLVAAPCYVGITGAAALLDIRVIAVEERHAEGLSCADLEQAVVHQLGLGRRPRAFYLVPDHSNPSGNTVELDVRRELLELAERYDFLILEDSPYRSVSPGAQLPTLKALDRGCRVVHIGSYSKTVFPGARVGFIVADQLVRDGSGQTGRLADELTKIKSMVTVNTSPLSQAAVAGMLIATHGRVTRANEHASAHYSAALKAMVDRLEHQFPAERLGVRWNRPSGGFFLALDVPFAANDEALARSAQHYGVIWTPMSYFHLSGRGRHTMRLSFSYLSPAVVEEGIDRLARFIRAAADQGDREMRRSSVQSVR